MMAALLLGQPSSGFRTWCWSQLQVLFAEVALAAYRMTLSARLAALRAARTHLCSGVSGVPGGAAVEASCDSGLLPEHEVVVDADVLAVGDAVAVLVQGMKSFFKLLALVLVANPFVGFALSWTPVALFVLPAAMARLSLHG